VSRLLSGFLVYLDRQIAGDERPAVAEHRIS
jgi:hypothetical protein